MKRTTNVIRRYYWWPQLAKSVRDYCATCDICQRMKVPRHRPYGLIQPLPRPEKAWQDISLDFIVGLPPSKRRRKVYNAVLMVVDRYLKMVQYIPCSGDIDSLELVEVLLDEIFSKYRILRLIISDRGATFTLKY